MMLKYLGKEWDMLVGTKLLSAEKCSFSVIFFPSVCKIFLQAGVDKITVRKVVEKDTAVVPWRIAIFPCTSKVTACQVIYVKRERMICH